MSTLHKMPLQQCWSTEHLLSKVQIAKLLLKEDMVKINGNINGFYRLDFELAK